MSERNLTKCHNLVQGAQTQTHTHTNAPNIPPVHMHTHIDVYHIYYTVYAVRARWLETMRRNSRRVWTDEWDGWTTTTTTHHQDGGTRFSWTAKPNIWIFRQRKKEGGREAGGKREREIGWNEILENPGRLLFALINAYALYLISNNFVRHEVVVVFSADLPTSNSASIRNSLVFSTILRTYFRSYI